MIVNLHYRNSLSGINSLIGMFKHCELIAARNFKNNPFKKCPSFAY